MAAIVHSPPALGRLRQEGGTARKPECESFVDEIVNGILADKRPEHGIDGLLTPLIALKFLECFAVAEDYEHTEIKGLFHTGPRDRQRPAQAHVIYAADTTESAQGSQKKILIVKIARSFQPKQHHVDDLAGAGRGSLCASRRKRECGAAQKYHDGQAEDEQEVHLPDQYRRSKPPARHQN